ncbi:helix-turn-helix domain-containing protein [Pseudomonas fulva]|uniref:helix-turn-helix domain-containing protein n=1 Tax=Pseudomonas fulva TaxID=47880 RepID=UPI003CF7B0A1
MKSAFSENLLLLCKHYPSIAEVCRKLDLNRAQFNKYLSGQSVPSAYNLKRICDFFGVEEHELSLPTEKFRTLLTGAQTRELPKATTPSTCIIESIQERSSDDIARYTGYYYEYYHSMSTPGYILCSLVYLRKKDGVYIYNRKERLQSFSGSIETYDRYAYRGVAYSLKDRFFLIDYESLTGNEISQTIIVPSHKRRISRLNGLKLGVSSGDQRSPACTRVVWDYLGESINRVDAYQRVRLYAADDDRIDDDLRERLASTEISQGLFKMR